MFFAGLAITIAAFIWFPLFGDSQEANNDRDNDRDNARDNDRDNDRGDDTPPPYNGVRTKDGSSPPPQDTPKDEMFLRTSAYDFIKGLPEDEASQLKGKLSPSPKCVDNKLWNLVQGLMNQPLLSTDKAAELGEEFQEAKESFERASRAQETTQSLCYATAYNVEKLDRDPYPPYVCGATILVGILASGTSIFLCGSPVKTVKDLTVNFCVGVPAFLAAVILVPSIDYVYALYSKQSAEVENEQTRQKMTIAKKAMDETKEKVLRDLAVHLFELTFRGYMTPSELEVNPNRMISSLVADKEISLSPTDLCSVKGMYQGMCLKNAMGEKNMMDLLKKAASSKGETFPLDPKMFTLPNRFNGRDLEIDPSKIPSVYLALILTGEGFNENPLLCINSLMYAAIMYKNEALIEWMAKVKYLPESYKESALLNIAVSLRSLSI